MIQRPISVLCSNIAVENSSLPQVIRITIKQSKTGPFRNRVSLFLGRTSVNLCPVESLLLDNLVVRGSKDGPLFIFKDGRPLTRQCLVTVLREVLQVAGMDQSKYSGHSFRIVAATTAAARGMEDSIIKTLGRWNSVAYLQYVKIPREQMASYSKILCI